jgi:hypothetical protein
MQILTEDIRNGLHVGKMVWICHYHRPDLDKKPLRCIPPTYVKIRRNDETDKKIYYSKNHFVKLRKDGTPSATIYSPVDNTGYRSRSGSELFVFESEDECIVEWNKQIDECASRIDSVIKTIEESWKRQKVELISKKK